jgi:hypothetical protein
MMRGLSKPAAACGGLMINVSALEGSGADTVVIDAAAGRALLKV